MYGISCCSPGVNLGTSIEEYFDDVDITPRGSQAERRVVWDIAVFLIGSPQQQQLNNLTNIDNNEVSGRSIGMSWLWE